MYMSPLTFVVIAANVLGGVMAFPQARKMLRTRSLEGVSLTWAAISATVNAWWGVYGIAIGDLGIVPVSAVSVMAYLVIALGVVRLSAVPTRVSARLAAGPAAAISIVPAIALLLHGWVVAGIALGALYGVQLSPAVVAVYRAIDVSGVSAATWVIAFVEAALWGVYGTSGGDVGIITMATTGVLMSSLVLVRLLVRRPRRSRGVVPVGAGGLVPA